MTLTYRALKGRYVRFRVRDVHLPEPDAVLHELHRAEVLEGRVVGFSDNGTEDGAFLVLKVRGIRPHCILPVHRVLGARAARGR